MVCLNCLYNSNHVVFVLSELFSLSLFFFFLNSFSFFRSAAPCTRAAVAALHLCKEKTHTASQLDLCYRA